MDIYTYPILFDMAKCMQRTPNHPRTRPVPGPLKVKNVGEPLVRPKFDVFASILSERSNIEDIYPATDAQRAFVIEAQKWCCTYCAWTFLSIANTVSIAQVHDLCKAVAQRYPIL